MDMILTSSHDDGLVDGVLMVVLMMVINEIDEIRRCFADRDAYV